MKLLFILLYKMFRYSILNKIVQLICDNLENECEQVNEFICELINSLKSVNLNYMDGIDEKIFDIVHTNLVTKDNQTNQIYINGNITDDDIEKIIVYLLKKKPKLMTNH